MDLSIDALMHALWHAPPSPTCCDERLQMTKPLRNRITDRDEWPDASLRSLKAAVDEELARRTAESTESEEELETLEQRLLREARRYQNGGAAIRG